MLLIPFTVLLFSSLSFAAGGFEKPVLWSARATQHGGAYTGSVTGAESLYFNPASLISERDREFHVGISSITGTSTAPLVTNQEKSAYSKPISVLGAMYSKNISHDEAIGFGLYSVGGLNVTYSDVDLTTQGSEFSDFRPDIYGKLAVVELGTGYSKKINNNLQAGFSLRQNYAQGGFSQVQVSQAQGLGGFGIPDGTVLAISQGEFKDLDGFSFGNYALGINYLTDSKDQGVSIVYRSRVNFELETKGKGKLVYSNAGAAATPTAVAGQLYSLKGNNTSIASKLPEAWTVSYFNKVTNQNKLLVEYTWTEYSSNQELSIDGALKNPVDNSTTPVSDVVLKWQDMHDFKFGWINTTFESWTLGGGYSLTLPVTDRKHTGPTFAGPHNYHHFYAGAGKAFSNFRIDGGLEYYFGSGSGSTQRLVSGNQAAPSIKGYYETKATALFLSSTWYL
jgi:long-subunit fatty acid transport protein